MALIPKVEPKQEKKVVSARLDEEAHAMLQRYAACGTRQGHQSKASYISTFGDCRWENVVHKFLERHVLQCGQSLC